MSARGRRRGEARGMSHLRAGTIALVLVGVLTYLGFTKDIPFTGKTELRAVFPTANSIRTGSAVRIAGVDVGKVKRVEAQPGSDAAIVTMEMDDEGLPVHSDATAKIRPRIFLEGNFFVDLRPGSPSAPVLGDGDTILVTQTATPVQLDEVLTALQEDTREDLKDLLGALAAGFTDEPTRAQDRRNDRSTRGETAAESLNDAAAHGPAALRSTAIVNDALLGLEPARDVRRLLDGLGRAAGGLARDEAALGRVVGNLDRTLGAFAAEQAALRASLRELPPALRSVNDGLGNLNASFPGVRGLARDLLPGVRETPATLEAAFPWMQQARPLLSAAELRGVARRLAPATRDLGRLISSGIELFPRADRLALCATEVVLPTGDVVIRDEFETGAPNYRELLYAMVGLAGEGQNFDGNGIYVRFQPGGGSNMVSVGAEGTPGSRLFGNAFPGLGTRPKMPPRRPPYDDDTPCHLSARPDLNGPWAAKGSFGETVR